MKMLKVPIMDKLHYITERESGELLHNLNAPSERVIFRGGIYVKKDIGSISPMTKEEIARENAKISVLPALPAGRNKSETKIENAFKCLLLAISQDDEKKKKADINACIFEHGKNNTEMQMVRIFWESFGKTQRFTEFHADFIKKNGVDNVKNIFCEFNFN